MASHAVLPLWLVIAVVLAGCSAAAGETAEASTAPTAPTAASNAVQSVEVGSGSAQEGDWYDTWEEAAAAEARRLHPELTGITTELVDLTRLDERILVRANGGYCAVYGGMELEGRWQATESLVLDDCGDE